MRRLSVVVVLALAAAGCKKKEPAPPAGAMADAAAAPMGAAPAQAGVKGKVLERLDAPPYSYLRLQTAQGEAWAAVPQANVQKGQDVTIAGAMPMTGFESKTLKRKFDTIYFGTLAGAEGVQAQPAAAPMGGAHAMGGGMGGAPMGGGMGGGEAMGGANIGAQHAAAAAGPAEVADVKVAKATGADARTVAEIHAQRNALKEKAVTFRGKVVKVNEGIMGRNWLHLRDGTGSAGKDNDITVTTGDHAAVGDVVLVKGVVRIDKDFGAGYAYPVIVEDAKLQASK